MKNLIIILLLVALGCSAGPAPKDVVFDFIAAVRNSDTTRVVQLLDIDTYVKGRTGTMSSADSATVLAAYRDSTMQALLGEGEVRDRWTKWQIVVNKEIRQDSLAEVEVSFIDRTRDFQLYTKFQLERQPDNTWRITYFR